MYRCCILDNSCLIKYIALIFSFADDMKKITSLEQIPNYRFSIRFEDLMNHITTVLMLQLLENNLHFLIP